MSVQLHRQLSSYRNHRKMEKEKEKDTDSRNDTGPDGRGGVRMFSAPCKRPLRAMLSLPEGIVAEDLKTVINQQEELDDEKKALKKKEEELEKKEELAELFKQELAGVLKNQKEELAEETKTLKYGQKELAQGLATLFTMEQDMKKKNEEREIENQQFLAKHIKLACDEKELQREREESVKQNQNQELLTKQSKVIWDEKELQKRVESAKLEQKLYKDQKDVELKNAIAALQEAKLLEKEEEIAKCDKFLEQEIESLTMEKRQLEEAEQKLEEAEQKLRWDTADMQKNQRGLKEERLQQNNS